MEEEKRHTKQFQSQLCYEAGPHVKISALLKIHTKINLHKNIQLKPHLKANHLRLTNLS